MGDNIWMRLYGSQFYKVFPFDSFNANDIDGVDNGIKKDIY